MAGVLSPDVTAIPLGRPLPNASSNQPERRGQRTRPCDAVGAACRSYSVLLPAGLAMPPTLPPARCALTAPFHPCLLAWRPCGPRSGGLLSVALSLGSPPPDVIRRRIRMEPGLSSVLSGGRPADWRRTHMWIRHERSSINKTLRAGRGTYDPPCSLKTGPDCGIVALSGQKVHPPPRI